MQSILILSALALGADTADLKGRAFHGRTGKLLSIAQLADELAERDVVFFGEEHTNDAGHAYYAALLPLLAERRPDLVVSMEMFERDVQGTVNDYLRGRLPEAEFLERSRPWKNFAKHYAPTVAFAKQRQLDVIAGNLPKAEAMRVATAGLEASPHFPRSTTAPKDRYWTLFLEAMKGHPGMGDGATEKMYKSQCIKDDAMAEAIADYLAQHAHRQPLVVHRCGGFHSDYGLGTATRVAQRVPAAQLGIVSMVAVPDVAKADPAEHRGRGHYLLFVPPSPTPPAPTATKDAKPAPAKDARKAGAKG